MSGPNYPLAKGFEMAGWRILPLDILFGDEHDLSKLDNQVRIRQQLKQADFIWAALDCSDKTRIREIKRKHADGRPMPSPLRSVEYPMGLPDLQGHNKERVASSNAAAEWILGELRLHQSRGGCSGRENPANSLHWYTPTEVGMLEGGTWWDQLYDACTLQGARKKKQCIRHDVEEIRLWPDMRCRHLHHPQEWTPQVDEDGKTWYPSKEEAEYTACLVFHIVYSVSAWACRVGKAKMAIPRRPPVECTGDRREWLQLNTNALRSWAMIPMALAVGLDIGEITKEESRGVIPSRHQINGKLGQTLKADEVYIGHGHHSHRQKASKWASPFTVGQHGTTEECLIMYTGHISSSHLAEEIDELIGKKLLSDTPSNMPCTADILIAMVYYAWRNDSLKMPQAYVKPRKKVQLTPNKWSRRALSLMSATVGDAWRSIYSERGNMARQPPLPLASHHRWQQQAITETFASYFPEAVFDDFHFPYIEDVINLPAFVRYAEWVEEKGVPAGCSRPPSHVGRTAARAARGAEGVQLRAFSHSAALPPLVSFGLSPDQHFKQALEMSERALPTERSVMVDEDLKYAASMMVGNKCELRQLRDMALKAVKQLKHRWRPVTARLRKIQQEGVGQVTKARDIGLLTLLSILLLWPDHTCGEHLVFGFPGVGHCEWSGVFPRREVPPSTKVNPFAGAAQHNRDLLVSMRPGKDDRVILEKSLVDADKGFATQPMSHAELVTHLKGEEFRLIRRFVITQSTGKQRIIDDAAAGGQSEASTDENILGFCNALQPAHHLAALTSELVARGMPWPKDESVSSGGEDWPDAYRYTPMRPEESRACVVVWWHQVRGIPVFQIYNSLLSGLPNAVTSFNRWSKFAQALVRRLLMMFFSMYFDDATMQDWESEAFHSQACVADLMQMLGSPWATQKSQSSAYIGDFLGLMHDVSRAEQGILLFRPRDSLVTKVLSIICIAREAGLHAGMASKLYGVANFIETGMYSRVGRAGLWAIKDRQKECAWCITPAISLSFDLLSDLFKLKPQREYLLWKGLLRRALTASDAAYEGGKGSAGFLSVIDPGKPEETRLGKVITLPASLYSLWGAKETYIAQLELLAVLVALIEVAGLVRGANTIWFIDNIAALMALVRGSSNSRSLD